MIRVRLRLLPVFAATFLQSGASGLESTPPEFTGGFVSETELVEDSDGDGLSDEWENQYFGNLRDQSHSDDPDGDGVDNLAEMEAGTNPQDPADH
jgi:hypothetical protein